MSHFSDTIKQLRHHANLSMQALADLSGVSKSMICKIEHEEVQPTLDVAARLAKAFGKSLSELLHTTKAVQVEYMPREEQAIWRDSTGIVRRNISPVFDGLKLEWLEVELPANTSIEKLASLSLVKGAKYILVKQGTLKVVVNEQSFMLQPGDSLYFNMDVKHGFYNEMTTPVIFYIVVKLAES